MVEVVGECPFGAIVKTGEILDSARFTNSLEKLKNFGQDLTAEAYSAPNKFQNNMKYVDMKTVGKNQSDLRKIEENHDTSPFVLEIIKKHVSAR